MDFTSQILRSTTMPPNQTWPADQEQPEGKASTSCAVTVWEKMRKEIEVPKNFHLFAPVLHVESSIPSICASAEIQAKFFMDTRGHVCSLTHWLAEKPTSRNASRNSSQVTVPLQRWPIHAHVSNWCHCRRGGCCEMSSTTHTDPNNVIIGASQTRDPDEHDKNHAPLALNCLDSW